VINASTRSYACCLLCLPDPVVDPVSASVSESSLESSLESASESAAGLVRPVTEPLPDPEPVAALALGPLLSAITRDTFCAMYL
jgi:hypothetical protein